MLISFSKIDNFYLNINCIVRLFLSYFYLRIYSNSLSYYYVDDAKAVIQLEPAIKFNGGGHINHSIFWTNLSPKGGGEPEGEG